MTHRNIWADIWPWILAGVVSGMAILTRATGLALVGVVGLALLLRVTAEIRADGLMSRSLRSAVKDGLVWAASTIVTIFLLLPALWVAPVDTLQKLWGWTSNAATEGHENPTFFRGIHFDDPGMAVYPMVLLWRTSPAEWLGIIFLITFGWWGWKNRDEESSRAWNLIIVATVFAIVYVMAMSVGAKKFDRYILPVFPVMALLAAQGLMLGKQWIVQRHGKQWTRVAYAAIAVALLSQVLAWNSTRPYRLDYYNPILGGSEQAQSIFQMGWGQGGDEVVDFLNLQTADGPITVQTSAVPSAFTYFLPDDSPVRFRNFSLRTPAGWYETDFYVAGIQQTQRGLAPGYDLLQPYDPIHVVKIGGVHYFEIYDVAHLPLPKSLASPTACNFAFGNRATLMQIVGREEAIDFYFLSMANNSDLTLEIRIDLPDGTPVAESVELPNVPSGQMTRASIPFDSGALPLADATIAISANSAGEPVGVTAPWLDGEHAEAITQSECYYTVPPE